MAQRLCILKKLVHASERQWSRLVIPSAQLPHFSAMQVELNALGEDFHIFVRDAVSSRIWHWGCRMTVMRPMILELSQFYNHHSVCAGDTVCVFRDLSTSQLTVEVERGPREAAAGQGGAAAGPAAVRNLEGPEDANGLAAGAAAAAGQLPAQRRAKGPAGLQEGASSRRRRRSPAGSEGEDEDSDYSPTAARSRGRGGGGSRGPLAVRRALHSATSAGDDSNEESSDVLYTAAQTKRFEALVDAAAQLSQSPLPAHLPA